MSITFLSGPFDQFAKRIQFAKQQFERELPSFKTGRFRWHKRRWVAQLDLGLLRKEWESFLLDSRKAVELESQGVLRRDETIQQFFERDRQVRRSN